ncbi:MAG: S24 family peptidase [Acetobacteraceae bacterium]|nr:S24 family peptidase [Acetobacteraceae bacterium]
MDILEKMARMIRDNPSITVRELATRLGYSEGKSVYYWLEKARFYGLKDFKRAVLTGQFRAAQPQEAEPSLPEAFLLFPATEVPLVVQFDSAGNPIYAEGRSIRAHLRPVAKGAFAYRLPTQEYCPLLLARDMVLVDPSGTPRNGELVLALVPKVGPRIFRYLGTPGHQLLIHPVDGNQPPPGEPPRLLGRVVQLVRAL